MYLVNAGYSLQLFFNFIGNIQLNILWRGTREAGSDVHHTIIYQRISVPFDSHKRVNAKDDDHNRDESRQDMTLCEKPEK